METQDLDRIRFVTRYFQDLQGLRHLIPGGLLLLGGAGAAFLAGWPGMVLTVASVLGAVLLALGARRYYRNAFGEVEPPRGRPVAELFPLSIYSYAGPVPPSEPLASRGRLGLMLGLIPAVFLLFQLLFFPPWIRLKSGLVTDPIWPVMVFPAKPFVAQMMGPLFGFFFLAVWWMRGRRLSQGHHLAMGILLAVLPVLGRRFPAVELELSFLMCGSALVLAGVLDHLQLVRTLGRPLREGN